MRGERTAGITGEEHDCAGFGALDFVHGEEGVEGLVGQGDGYTFLLLFEAVAWAWVVRHLRGEGVVLDACGVGSLSLPRPACRLSDLSQLRMSIFWDLHL